MIYSKETMQQLTKDAPLEVYLDSPSLAWVARVGFWSSRGWSTETKARNAGKKYLKSIGR